MEQDALLVRQAHRWVRQQKSGGMPDELYAVLARGARGMEKRQITSLARVSRIVSDGGSIRPYNDFKNDWKYVKSTFGKRDTCSLCGKRPIVENCMLYDEVADKHIVVGNTCVHRYVEIEVGGRVLTEEEKKEYLKTNMKEAKHHFNRKTFTQKYPSVMGDLKRWEQMMTMNRFASRHDPIHKLWKRIHRNMVKRMISHGYPSPKLSRQWDEFYLTAEDEYTSFCEMTQEHEEKMLRLREERERQRVEMAQKMTEMRNRWADEANQFEQDCSDLGDALNHWEKNMARKVSHRIRHMGGIERLSGGYRNFHNEIIAKMRLRDSDIVDAPDLVKELERWLNSDRFLNEWEQAFCNSVMVRSLAGSEITSKQNAILEKLRKRFE